MLSILVEGTFSRSIRVEGGKNNKVASEFNGPLIVNNKITSNSDEVLKSNSLFLQGNATVSRKFSGKGISTPIVLVIGDVIFNANPNEGSHVGWIYTLESSWRRYGNLESLVI